MGMTGCRWLFVVVVFFCLDYQYWYAVVVISFDSYIKPQRSRSWSGGVLVVYLLIPTSNHNVRREWAAPSPLYIFWFLHQTTTPIRVLISSRPLYIFWFLHQTTTVRCVIILTYSCISFDSYIKPQQLRLCQMSTYSCISFDSYIKPQLVDAECRWPSVVYLLIPTSNHNCRAWAWTTCELYIFWFLHQTTTIVIF